MLCLVFSASGKVKVSFNILENFSEIHRKTHVARDLTLSFSLFKVELLNLVYLTRS